MANIPNSSRYRTVGSSRLSISGTSGSERSSDPSRGYRGRTVNQPFSLIPLFGFLAVGLLIAFPYHVLGVIGFGLLINWLFAKK